MGVAMHACMRAHLNCEQVRIARWTCCWPPIGASPGDLGRDPEPHPEVPAAICGWGGFDQAAFEDLQHRCVR